MKLAEINDMSYGTVVSEWKPTLLSSEDLSRSFNQFSFQNVKQNGVTLSFEDTIRSFLEDKVKLDPARDSLKSMVERLYAYTRAENADDRFTNYVDSLHVSNEIKANLLDRHTMAVAKNVAEERRKRIYRLYDDGNTFPVKRKRPNEATSISAEVLEAPTPSSTHKKEKLSDQSSKYYNAIDKSQTNGEKLDYILGLKKEHIENANNFTSKTLIPIQNCFSNHFGKSKQEFVDYWFPKKFACSRFNSKCSVKSPCEKGVQLLESSIE